MKSTQIEDRTRPTRQFEVKMVLNSELELKSDSVILNWVRYPSWHADISLPLQHPLDVSHVLYDPLLDLAGAKEEGDA
jgi:hypothetical protein